MGPQKASKANSNHRFYFKTDLTPAGDGKQGNAVGDRYTIQNSLAVLLCFVTLWGCCVCYKGACQALGDRVRKWFTYFQVQQTSNVLHDLRSKRRQIRRFAADRGRHICKMRFGPRELASHGTRRVPWASLPLFEPDTYFLAEPDPDSWTVVGEQPSSPQHLPASCATATGECGSSCSALSRLMWVFP